VSKPVKAPRGYTMRRRQQQSQDTRRRIVEAARTLYLARGYQAVTMADIAAHAGVAYQTVYATFGNKARLTQEIIWTTFEVAGVNDVITVGMSSREPEDWLRGVARAARLVSEHLAELLRFLQESGDPALLAEYHKVQTRRREQESDLASRLSASGRLRADLDHDRAWDILWVFSGTHLYEQLVVQQGWTPDTYESWLGDLLIAQVLAARDHSPRRRPPR
jgi:AcrR family transcriptional regulator